MGPLKSMQETLDGSWINLLAGLHFKDKFYFDVSISIGLVQLLIAVNLPLIYNNYITLFHYLLKVLMLLYSSLSV